MTTRRHRVSPPGRCQVNRRIVGRFLAMVLPLFIFGRLQALGSRACGKAVTQTPFVAAHFSPSPGGEGGPGGSAASHEPPKPSVEAGTPAVGNTISLTPAPRAKLVRLVRSDSEAAMLFQKRRRVAGASLDAPAHPVVRIATAGKLASDPAKVKSRVGLEDMRELYALGFAAAVTSNPAYGAAAKRMILTWARTNQPTGVPIDESKLEPLFVAYDLTRPAYSDEDRGVVETWLRTLARREMEGTRTSSVTARN